MTTYHPPQDVRRYRLAAMQDKVREGWQWHLNLSATESPRLLHWDSKSYALQIWPWPCYPDGRRVPPDELQEYFCEYQARAPCCLCAYLDANKYYAAAKISLLESVNAGQADAEMRPFVGEYVAECATKACGYSVILERFYACKVLMQKSYAKRASRFDISLYDHFLSDEFLFGVGKPQTGFKRVFVGSTQHEGSSFSRSPNGLKRLRDEYEEDIQQSSDQLQTLADVGLPESDFWEQFVQCATCDHVIPRHLYPYAHQCFKRIKVLRPEGPSALTSSDGGSRSNAGASSSSVEEISNRGTGDLLERLAREAAEEDTDDDLTVDSIEGDSDDELTPDAVIRYIRASNSHARGGETH